ncbi:zinc-binding dehydrogenase [Citrobacter youngae]|nr:zinc-binding dehydrogenase [Citrobacter youngae]
MGQQMQRNRRWVLASRPHGAPVPGNFRLEEEAITPPVTERCYCVTSTSHSIPICVGV